MAATASMATAVLPVGTLPATVAVTVVPTDKTKAVAAAAAAAAGSGREPFVDFHSTLGAVARGVDTQYMWHDHDLVWGAGGAVLDADDAVPGCMQQVKFLRSTVDNSSTMDLAFASHSAGVVTHLKNAYIYRHSNHVSKSGRWSQLPNQGHEGYRRIAVSGIEQGRPAGPDMSRAVLEGCDGILYNAYFDATADTPNVERHSLQLPHGEVIESIHAGELAAPADSAFFCVVTRSGKLYVSSMCAAGYAWQPVQLTQRVVAAACGLYPNVVALTSDGEIIAWRLRGAMQAGPLSLSPQRDFTAIAADPCGSSFAGLKADGSIVHFGVERAVEVVKHVKPPAHTKFEQLALGYGSAFAVTNTDALMAWATPFDVRNLDGLTSRNIIPSMRGEMPTTFQPETIAGPDMEGLSVVRLVATSRSVLVTYRSRKRPRPDDSSDASKGRNCRRFSEMARQKMEDIYQRQTTEPSPAQVFELSKEFGESVPRVRTWFSNRRAKDTMMNVTRKKRRRISPGAREVLMAAYQQDTYANDERCEELAARIGEAPVRVKNWFSNQRAKKRMPNDNVKRRMRFSQEDLAALREAFSMDRHPKKEALMSLAQQLNTSHVRVRNWFANRRAREGLPKHPDGRRRRSTDSFRKLAAAANPHRVSVKDSGRRPRGYKRVYAQLSFGHIEDQLSAGQRHVTGFFKLGENPFTVRFTATKIGTGVTLTFRGEVIAVIPPSPDESMEASSIGDYVFNDDGGDALAAACAPFALKTATPLGLCKILVKIAIQLTFDGGPSPAPCLKHDMEIKPDAALAKFDHFSKHMKRPARLLKPALSPAVLSPASAVASMLPLGHDHIIAGVILKHLSDVHNMAGDERRISARFVGPNKCQFQLFITMNKAGAQHVKLLLPTGAGGNIPALDGASYSEPAAAMLLGSFGEIASHLRPANAAYACLATGLQALAQDNLRTSEGREFSLANASFPFSTNQALSDASSGINSKGTVAVTTMT